MALISEKYWFLWITKIRPRSLPPPQYEYFLWFGLDWKFWRAGECCNGSLDDNSTTLIRTLATLCRRVRVIPNYNTRWRWWQTMCQSVVVMGCWLMCSELSTTIRNAMSLLKMTSRRNLKGECVSVLHHKYSRAAWVQVKDGTLHHIKAQVKGRALSLCRS